MSYLKYISDEALLNIVKNVLNIGIAKKTAALKDFTKNVIDPFGSLFEAAAFGVDYKTWKNSEIARQCQKTLQNHVGELHQKILGSVDGWQNLNTGSIADLVCQEKRIVAEVKNKYNTVTGSKLSDQYQTLADLVMPKNSIYTDYIAYFVNIIPKTPTRFDKPFTPSNKATGTKCPTNEKIRIIDGASFYTLVTGQEKALFQLHQILPDVIEEVFRVHYGVKTFKFLDKKEFSKYFTLAYEK